MGLFDGIFGGGANPMDAANKYIGQIPDVARQQLDPFIQRGERAGGALEEQYGGMMQDPTGFLNKLMEQYAPSDAYKYQQSQMGQVAANTAAAGGQRGGGADQAEQQRITQGLLSQDMQNWLGNVMGIQDRGTQGEQGFYNTGYGASSNLADTLANVLGTQGSMAFRDAMQKNQNPLDMLTGALGGLGMMGGLPVSGGGSLAGNWLSKYL